MASIRPRARGAAGGGSRALGPASLRAAGLAGRCQPHLSSEQRQERPRPLLPPPPTDRQTFPEKPSGRPLSQRQPQEKEGRALSSIIPVSRGAFSGQGLLQRGGARRALLGFSKSPPGSPESQRRCCQAAKTGRVVASY